MPQQQVEMILMRQLASYLSVPIFLAGQDEKLSYYNEAAERLLGRPFNELGDVALEDLSDLFQITGEDGSPLAANEIPLGVALRQRRFSHRIVLFRGLDGVERKTEVTAFPLDGQAGRHLGAVAIFWELSKP